MRSFLHLGRTRLAQGTAVGFYGLGAQLLLQLVSVPVLTQHWGLGGYGVWVMLFTVPALLAMADFGLTRAGSNAMIAATVRGEREVAARIFVALGVITAMIGVALVAIAALTLYALPTEILDFSGHFTADQTRLAALLLFVYGALGLINGVAQTGFHAADAFAYGGWLFHTSVLVETLAALTVAILGGSPTQVALAFCLVRIVGTVLMALAMRLRAPWLRLRGQHFDLTELRSLLGPALSTLVYFGANAAALQGAVLAIGAVGGPAAVPAYALVRTLSRTALQFAFRFNVASMPRYTVFVAQKDHARAVQLVLLNLIVALALTVPVAVVLAFFGQPLVQLWTGGLVEPGFELVLVLVLAMLANAVWIPLSNLIMAINRHGGFTWFYLAAACVSLAAGAVMVQHWGALGMAWAALGLELAMIVQVWLLALRLKMFDADTLRKAFGGLREELRQRGLGAKDRKL